jgi:hypothetical protein
MLGATLRVRVKSRMADPCRANSCVFNLVLDSNDCFIDGYARKPDESVVRFLALRFLYQTTAADHLAGCAAADHLAGCAAAASLFGKVNGSRSGVTRTPVVNLSGYLPPVEKVNSTKYAVNPSAGGATRTRYSPSFSAVSGALL